MSAIPKPRTLALVALAAACVVAAAGGATALWLRHRIASSLPALDGTLRLHGLTAPVTVTRDALGVPVIEGANRLDVARATGFVHAQDRFFQMDILRRRGSGELSELFGKVALPLDRQARMHGFRAIARKVLEQTPPAKRAMAEAYAQGVNDGLSSLKESPWEYAILRTAPRPWSAEDCILVSFAMTLDLQDSTGRYVRELAAIRDTLGPASLSFFAPLETPDDAALDASVAPAPAVPPASEINLRKSDKADDAGTAWTGAPTWEDHESPGSNSFAVSGGLTGGPALVANDMHLRLSVPNIWYRMSLRWPGHAVTGVTLPGFSSIVAGSNGHVAWGFTNSNAGTSDIVIVDPGSAPELYHGPKGTGLTEFEVRHETIAVHGGKPVTLDFRWTLWGPVVGEGAEGRSLILHWTEDDPAATNLEIADLEEASTVQDAVVVAHRTGIPVQNFVVADASGQIAWTVAGFLPRRVGYNGRMPVKWSFGDRRWEGFLPADEVPTLISPPGGRLWTANNRTQGGRELALLGDSGYDMPARARQIRDDLDALGKGPVGPRDLLAIQLDDRALMMAPWHDLLLRTLNSAAVSGTPARAALLEAAKAWEGRASVGSVSYRITRAFRLAVAHRVMDPIFADCADTCPDFSWERFNYEQPLRTILRDRPMHLLGPAYASWDALLLAAVDDVSASLSQEGVAPAKATWGSRNTALISHPFARSLPSWASSWLSMPRDPLPGDSHMPRVQEPGFGASERFDVSPGRESEGIFHMPGGQCANPLSPYFSAGHEAWVKGEPTPFLPGSAQHTLTLAP